MTESDDSAVEVIHATTEHVEQIVPLFDEYRVWCRVDSDPDRARSYLTHRLTNGEAVVFLATVDGEPEAFALLYPLFSSVSMESVWVLNDLFVTSHRRRQGLGRLLMETVIEFGRSTGALRLELETEVTNLVAQGVYESGGWERIDSYYRYYLTLDR